MFFSLCFAVSDSFIPSQLIQWLWLTLIQQEINTLKTKFNDHVVQKDKEKKLLSGVSSNIAFSLMHLYGEENCLQPVDHNFVRKLLKDIGGEKLVQFITRVLFLSRGCFQGVGICKFDFS